MPFEQRDLSGALFKNTRGTGKDNPTHTGSCRLCNVDLWVNAWRQSSGNYDVKVRTKNPPEKEGEGELHPTGAKDANHLPLFEGVWMFDSKEWLVKGFINTSRSTGDKYLRLSFTQTGGDFPATPNTEACDW